MHPEGSSCRRNTLKAVTLLLLASLAGTIQSGMIIRAGQQTSVQLDRILAELDRLGKGRVCGGEWAGAKHLVAIDFSGTDLSDAQLMELAEHRDIAALDLSGTPVSDRSVAALARLTDLKRLDLSRTCMSAEAIQRLRSALPACEITGT